MIKPGVFQILKASRVASQGVYLTDDDGNEVLLPKKLIPEDLRMQDEIKVFVYNDSEDRPVATTQNPKITLGKFAVLKVKELTRYGAFLDWGLDKDLLLPFREQTQELKDGQSCIVYLYLDEQTNRLAASTRLNRFLKNEDINLQPGQEVDLLVSSESDLGVNVIINNTYSGLIFRNDLFRELQTGDQLRGFIKNIRTDNKVDVVLQKPGYEGIMPGVDKVLDLLDRHNGFLHVTDKSSPEDIRSLFGMSKKTFKKAIGYLYKQKVIVIKDDGIYRNKKN